MSVKKNVTWGITSLSNSQILQTNFIIVNIVESKENYWMGVLENERVKSKRLYGLVIKSVLILVMQLGYLMYFNSSQAISKFLGS